MFMELNFAHNLIKYTIEKKIFTVLDMNHSQVPIELKYHLCDSRVSRIRVMRSCGSRTVILSQMVAYSDNIIVIR